MNMDEAGWTWEFEQWQLVWPMNRLDVYYRNGSLSSENLFWPVIIWFYITIFSCSNSVFVVDTASWTLQECGSMIVLNYFLFIWIKLNLRAQVKPLLMVSFKVRQRNAYVASSAAEKWVVAAVHPGGLSSFSWDTEARRTGWGWGSLLHPKCHGTFLGGKKTSGCRGRWRSELKLLKWVGLKIAYPYIQWLMIFPIGIAFWGSTPFSDPNGTESLGQKDGENSLMDP